MTSATTTLKKLSGRMSRGPGNYPLDAWQEAVSDMEAGRDTKSVLTTEALAEDS